MKFASTDLNNIFECVCPTFNMCMGHGSLFDARCSKNLMPYVWLQSISLTNKN